MVMRIDNRLIDGKLVPCKCYFSMRNGREHFKYKRVIKPRKIRKDKGIKRGSYRKDL